MPIPNFEQSDRPRVPLRPPIRGQEQPAPRPERPAVGYRAPGTNEFVEVFHPEIFGMAGRVTSALPPDARVDVRLTDRTLNVQFRDYLAMTGISYADYQAAMRVGNTSNQQVLKQLHQAAIAQRLSEAIAIEREIQNQPGNYEKSEKIHKEAEGFLVRLINESGYARAALAPAQNDHREKIDLFLEVPASKNTDGVPAHFGIQHTMLREYDQDGYERIIKKEHQIKKRPQVFIPEHPEYGPVTRIFYIEDEKKYFPEGAGHSYDANLKALERKTGSKHRIWESLLYDGAGGRNQMTEAEARIEAVRRVYNLLTEIYAQLGEYLLSESAYQAKDIQKKRELVAAALQKIRRENPGVDPGFREAATK